MKSDSINVQVEVDIVPSKQFDEVAKKLGYTKTKICTTRTQQGKDEQEDSIELIREDAIKPFDKYWNCVTIDNCIDCHSKIDGTTPREHYGTNGCLKAMKIDLIERTVKVMKNRAERTCHMELRKRGANYDVFYFDCCDKEYAENKTDKYASFVIGDVCPYCGAKVVE